MLAKRFLRKSQRGSNVFISRNVSYLMEKKEAFVVTLVLFAIIIGSASFVFHVPVSPVTITGHALAGTVQLFVDSGSRVIAIHSPENTTYSFSIGGPYNVSLNVSADFVVDSWNYSLYDLKHGEYYNTSIAFSPNLTIDISRWNTRLEVSANDSTGTWAHAEVVFSVDVPNSAPIMGPVDNETFICEGARLDYRFNASDADEDVLTEVISPKQRPLYTTYLGQSGHNTSLFKIYSILLVKEWVGTYERTISVLDGEPLVDNADINITVIEINNPPVMTGIGAQTVWTQGDGSTFYHQMVVSDTEDGSSDDGGIEFNISFSGGDSPFGINETGVMDFTPTSDHLGRIYTATICALDNALASPHANIGVCSPRSGDAESVCDEFTLTITDSNRAPEIVSYSPISTNLSLDGTATTNFEVTVRDPDGTIPDIDWYVNGTLREHNEGASSDTFSYSPGCGTNADYNVTVTTTDGLLTDSQNWDLDVAFVACPVSSGSSSGGGGGGGGGLGGKCRESWVCDDWKVCQNLKRSFDARVISPEDYYDSKEICAQNTYDERFCGFQLTLCYDLNLCNNTVDNVPRPAESRICYYTENPSCSDGITNCHSGGCELLVDCGGPCGPCASCSDGIQNQGESDVDCGGPCPYQCASETPGGINYLIIILIFISLLILIFIIYKVIKISRHRYSIRKS